MKNHAVKAFLYDTASILVAVLGVMGSFGAFESGEIGFLRMIFQVVLFGTLCVVLHKFATPQRKSKPTAHKPQKHLSPTSPVFPAA